MDSKVQSIIKIIQDNKLQKPLFNGDYEEEQFEEIDDIDKYLNDLGLKNFENIDHVCNSDELYLIIHFKDDDIYLKISGEYDSYGNGDHYFNDSVKQVFPKQVTITKYE